MARNHPLSFPAIVLTDAATIAVDAALGNKFTVTLTATSRVIGAPSNPTADQMILIDVKQGGSGSYAYTFNAIFQFTAAFPFPTVSTAVGAVDIFGFKYNATSNKWWCIGYDLGHS
jgi:hypothetical protein